MCLCACVWRQEDDLESYPQVLSTFFLFDSVSPWLRTYQLGWTG